MTTTTTLDPFDFDAYWRVRRSVERDLRKQHAAAQAAQARLLEDELRANLEREAHRYARQLVSRMGYREDRTQRRTRQSGDEERGASSRP